MSADTRSEEDLADQATLGEIRRRRGQLLFAFGFVAISVLLLALIGNQTQWVKSPKLYAQPSFWPALSLSAMVLFGSLHLYRLPTRRLHKADWREGRIWLQPFEFALYFMVYVALVPVIGFLPATIGFAVLMVRRMGYRSARMLVWASVFAVGVVVIFKSLLGVKIPGALIYEWLPGSLRSFFILNF